MLTKLYCHFRAIAVVNEDGSKIRLSATNKAQREAIAKQLLNQDSASHGTTPNKKVSSTQILTRYFFLLAV